MTSSSIHVIGAGLAGLAAAVRLAGLGRRVTVHEAARHAGGRCRSYFDPVLDQQIDNGNHLILSGNHAALAYLDAIGSRHELHAAAQARYAFHDLATGERWTLDIGDSRAPLWIFDAARRPPGTTAADFLRLARLFWPRAGRHLRDAIACSGPLYERLLHPLLLSALNHEPPPASTKLAAAVLRESFAHGGRSCRPLYAPEGLSKTFVEPALRYVQAHGGVVRFNSRLRALEFANDRVAALAFDAETIDLGTEDAVVLAVPADAAARLVPGLSAPDEFRTIANIHFIVPQDVQVDAITAVLNGATQWIFAFPGRVSVTISDAEAWARAPREELARRVWSEVAQVTGLPAETPRWQVVRERKATFAATPEQDERRPEARTSWRNLALAGDWTRTGLPATIEGAIRSGNVAADLARRQAAPVAAGER